ncbi:sugar phosphate isomerase/epimerase family protein [Microtetraspora malaysiensis]|uniref:sugar phosphate isomerase/epimerase family protein n=1 Tax=Microtetraspora malaysiensis TaxID=161358 RepID=UPI00082C8177|nr:sugar phosphate isomerase/epimerase family protein [Microtetraspora malaysiensis]
MKIGVDGRKLPGSQSLGPIGSLEKAAELGMEGAFFRTVLDMSPSLNPHDLAGIRRRADELGLYLETGLGKVNPYASPETPELRSVGDGDVLLGFRRMMEACAAIDCRELWIGTASFKLDYRGRWTYDRFRTDVDWADQLEATTRFLHRLAPIARDLGIHMNVETHEDITSFEAIRMVEAVGPDVMGIVFDTANVLQRIEHPIMAAERVAPYVRQTHIKDAGLTHVDGELTYQMRPCGEGVIDFTRLLRVIRDANPTVNLTIENEQAAADRPAPRIQMVVDLYGDGFLEAHPDLTVEELTAYMRMVMEYERRCRNEGIPGWRQYFEQDFDEAAALHYISASATHLRAALAEIEEQK